MGEWKDEPLNTHSSQLWLGSSLEPEIQGATSASPGALARAVGCKMVTTHRVTTCGGSF